MALTIPSISGWHIFYQYSSESALGYLNQISGWSIRYSGLLRDVLRVLLQSLNLRGQLAYNISSNDARSLRILGALEVYRRFSTIAPQRCGRVLSGFVLC